VTSVSDTVAHAENPATVLVHLQGNAIKPVALADVVAEVRRVPTDEYEALGLLFG
jgi:hypothetical protein